MGTTRKEGLIVSITRSVRFRRIVSAALVLLLLTAGGCAALSSTEEAAVEPYAPVTSEDAARSSAGQAPGVELSEQDKALGSSSVVASGQMIVRTRTLRLEVDSTPTTVKKLRELAKSNAAVITDLQVATESDGWLYRTDEYGSPVGGGTALRGWMTLRVPAENLDAFMDEAMQLGTVKYQSEGSEDVTQQHVDLTARLENLRAEEARLRTFFDAAKNVQEMLAVESELNRIRAEIESMDAQVKYLERQAALATVTVEITEEQPVVSPAGDDWGFVDAITTGFRGAAGVIKGAITVLIASAPLWILGLAIFFVIRAVVRGRRRRQVADTSTPPEITGSETEAE